MDPEREVQRREELQALLQGILDAIVENKKAYFQPNVNTELVYPCIIFKHDDLAVTHANNMPYRFSRRYQVTAIDTEPDSKIWMEIAKLPKCSYERFFTADNLNHHVLNLYF